MTPQEWDSKWWDEFHKLREANPTASLFDVQSKALEIIKARYGARPSESGPPWWTFIAALALGVPKEMLTNVWTWLNGKKTAIGAVITVAADLTALAGVTLPAFGVSAVHVAQYVGYGTVAVGVLHKIYKFVYHEDHP